MEVGTVSSPITARKPESWTSDGSEGEASAERTPTSILDLLSGRR